MSITEPDTREVDDWHLMQALGVGNLQDVHPAIATLKREREEALQEAGRLRARVGELEAVARLVADAAAGITLLDHAGDGPVWRARVALGLNGRTGHRDINAEVSRG